MTSETDERWRPVKGHPEYEVSDRGRVRSWKPRFNGDSRPATPRIMSPGHNDSGYEMVILCSPNRGRTAKRVHRLVAEAFCDRGSANNWLVRHLDGNRTNNAWTNLAWGTGTDNREDQYRLGEAVFGERHPCAKLTDDQARAIYFNNTHTSRHLSSVYGVSESAVNSIRAGKTKRRVTGASGPGPWVQGRNRRRAQKLTESAVIDIFTSPATHAEMGRKYGVLSTTVLRIRQRAGWSHITKGLPDVERPHVRVGAPKELLAHGLSPEAVRDIFMSPSTGTEMAAKYATSETTVSMIRTRRIATAITSGLERPARSSDHPLTSGDIRAIYASTDGLAALARRHGVSRTCVWRIRTGRSHTDVTGALAAV